MKKILYSLLLVFCLSGSIIADRFRITDSYGRTVQFDSTPVRVISCAPNITEFVFALGKGKNLVGRTDYCDYPVNVSSVESIGGLQDPNIEKIVSLDPDVVIASTHFKKENVKILEQADIKVVVYTNQESFEGVYTTMRQIGTLLDAETKAEKNIRAMKKDVSAVESALAGINDKPKVYYLVGFGQYGDYTAGGNTFIGKLLEQAGATNIAADLEGWAYSFEKIVEEEPEIIICSQFWGTGDSLRATDGYKDLPAVVNGNLLEIDNNLLDRQGPRLAEGLEVLARAFHPERF